MENIKEILERQPPSIEDLIYGFEQVKKRGDVAVIKFDGERNEYQYTVFISFPNQPEKLMIRSDGDDLKTALFDVLTQYVGS